MASDICVSGIWFSAAGSPGLSASQAINTIERTKIYPSELRKTFFKPNVYLVPSGSFALKPGLNPDSVGTSYIVQDNSGLLRCRGSSNPDYLGFDLTSLLL